MLGKLVSSSSSSAARTVCTLDRTFLVIAVSFLSSSSSIIFFKVPVAVIADRMLCTYLRIPLASYLASYLLALSPAS